MRAELSPYAVDPFGPSANPSAYVACEASERARAILERSLDEGHVGALLGPPGHGKTLLLRLLGGREEERARVAYVPFCTLEFEELCALVLNAIGVSRPGPPRDVLAAVTRELAPRGGVVVLVDDAHAMSDACAHALAALYEELGGALRIALAAVQGPAAQRVIRAFGSKIDVVLLAGGMSGREARRYVEMRLAYGGARPEIVAAFDEATIDALHRASQGVPRRLNQAAEDVVRRATRSELPRLRQLTARAAAAPPASQEDTGVRVGRESPQVSRSEPKASEEHQAGASRHSQPPTASVPAAPLPAAAAPRPEPVRLPPSRPTAPRVPIASAPQPAPNPEPPVDDGRGILLPEVFRREPGEPAGEYRIVRGSAVAPTPPHGAVPATPRRPLGARESVLVTSPPETPARRSREIPMPSAYADRVPRARRPTGLPIRAIGVAGFVLGIAVSMTWILGREPDPPRVLPMRKPPAQTAIHPPAPDPMAPRPARPAEAAPAARPVPEPAAPPERAPAPPRAAAPIPAVRTRVLVSINATPWAIVSIDGREVGETPLAGIPLEPGRHLFEARMPDGSTRAQTVDVSAQRRAVAFQ
jgi:type II secretory pathway predicted ATPase ExeA